MAVRKVRGVRFRLGVGGQMGATVVNAIVKAIVAGVVATCGWCGCDLWQDV